MNLTLFLGLLFAFSLASSLIVEAVKKLITEKQNASYNLIALLTALGIGIGGMAVYYQLNSIPYSINNLIFMFLMGIANALCATLGYDKVKQTIRQMFGQKSNKGGK